MARGTSAFRVGRVRAYRRGNVWYLCYYECGIRRRPRVGPDRKTANLLAAQINAQLTVGTPAAFSFGPIAIPELRQRWLEHHEQVLRSSVHTVNRYRTATDHLLRFLAAQPLPSQSTAHFGARQAEDFAKHLRSIQVAPNGHRNTQKRLLFDKGVQYILQSCRTMFRYAAKRRHLPPYAENPFTTLEPDRMPIENGRPIVLFTPEQERTFLELCDAWQLPIFLTLMLTGMRPGELVHLLVPEDLDLESELLFVRNKPKLGWQVKTRNERSIPLVKILADVLRVTVGSRKTGPVFTRRRFAGPINSLLTGASRLSLERELETRMAARQFETGRPVTRAESISLARKVWRDIGALKTDRIRKEFSRLTRKLGQPELTCPKMLRHLFATNLQDTNVDPLIRNELMGHIPSGGHSYRALGTTALYTHTKLETKRRQLENAMSVRSCCEVAKWWLNLHR